MPSKKFKIKKGFLRPIHFEALVFVIIYFLISTFAVAKFVLNPNIYISLLGSFAFGAVSVSVFLYLFSHEDFFHFFKKLERFENKKEKQYLLNFAQLGKYLACLIVSIIGGQIFLALTVRFLFPKSASRYLIAIVVTFISTIIVISFGKSILGLFI